MMKYSIKKTISLAVAMIILMPVLPVFSVFAANLPEKGENALYVSPSGNDTNDGSFSSPLATLQGVKEKLKTFKGTSDGAVTVWLREGTYTICETLEFTSDDLPNVTYKAYNGEKVNISGSSEISGFIEETVNGVKCFTKQFDTSAENWYFKSLFNGETSLSTPRYPENGYFTVKSLNEDDSLWTDDTTPWSLTHGQRSFNADLNDVGKSFYNQNDVTVRILHYWHDEMMSVTGFDAATGRISLSRPSSMLIRDIDRYYFENVFEALNAPCEWYLDSVTGKLYYVPQEGELADALVLYGSSLEQLVTIDGVDGISFENICFTDTDWNITSPAESMWNDWCYDYDVDALQAALDVKGVIAVNNAADIHFMNCEFINLGGTAVKLKDNVHDSSVENCYFENIAATGIFAGGQNVPKGEPGSTYNITVKNNEIYKYGRKFFCAIGVHITHCDTAEIVNNEIHDGFYTAISCGWTWGYSYSTTQNVKIKDNLIYNIGQGWLSDMGGIYMLGIQNGTVISGNVIHNVAADESEGGYGGWGIYLDEGSSDMIVEKNLVYCCGSQGLNIHYGEGNTIRNNISALNALGLVSPGGRDEKHATAFYYNNIFLTDGGAPIYVNARYEEENAGEHFYENGNVMWDLSLGDELYICNTDDFENAMTVKNAVEKGVLHNPTVANPLFKDAKGFDFTLAENSPAFATNFKAWDYSLAGTVKGSTIGTGKAGGQTAVTNAAVLVETKAASVPFRLYNILSAVIAALMILLIVLAIICYGNNGIMSRSAKTVRLIAIPVMAAAGYFLFNSFIAWNVPLYAAASVIFTLVCTIPASVFFTVAKPSAGKLKRALVFILCAAVFAAVIFGVIYMFNSVIKIGSKNACVIALLIAAVYESVIYILFFRKTRQKKA